MKNHTTQFALVIAILTINSTVTPAAFACGSGDVGGGNIPMAQPGENRVFVPTDVTNNSYCALGATEELRYTFAQFVIKAKSLRNRGQRLVKEIRERAMDAGDLQSPGGREAGKRIEALLEKAQEMEAELISCEQETLNAFDRIPKMDTEQAVKKEVASLQANEAQMKTELRELKGLERQAQAEVTAAQTADKVFSASTRAMHALAGK